MELTIDQALQQGIAAHREGKLQDAERIYRAILQVQPDHPDANHNLGVLAVTVGKPLEAIPLFKLALEANPQTEQFWLSYIDALIKTEKADVARRVLSDAYQAGIALEKLRAAEEQLGFELAASSHEHLSGTYNPERPPQGELSAAIDLREAGKYGEAQEWLHKFIKHHPANAEALSLLSQVLLLDKKEAEAEKMLTAAASIDPELPSVYRNQSRLLLSQSEPAEALERAQMGCTQSPAELESLLVLAACLGANQKDSEALSLIETILKAKSTYAEAYATRALIRSRKKDAPAAIKDAEVAVSLKPHLTPIWHLLGSLHQQSGDLGSAVEALRRAHNNEPTNAVLMLQLGKFLLQNNNSREAITIFERAKELAPGNAVAWTNLGVALQQEKRTADAKIAYEKALALNPGSAAVLSNLGAIAKEVGDCESAAQYFERALAIEPNITEAQINLGAALQELGRSEEAEAGYRKAIAQNPDFADAHYNLGNTLKELGKLDESEASLRKAISLAPDFFEAYNNLGSTLRELGRLEESEASYRHAIALKPDYAEAHTNLGNTLQELGKLGEAEASYRHAIALKPDYAEASLNLCEFLDKTNAIDKLLVVLQETSSLTNTRKADFRFYETLASFRKERYAEANSLFTQITEDEVSEKRRAPYYKLKGDLCHHKHDYDGAFLAYKNSNRTVKADREYRRLEMSADDYFESQKKTARQLEQLSMGDIFSNRPYYDERQPTFLVGFPRSGTTLLDTILRTHSRIAVIEEQPMVSKMNAALGGLEDLSMVEALDDDCLNVARTAYLRELTKHTSWPEESLMIDKLPLNLLKGPLINQAFPNAKFILAVRHPLDCVLSCWMQSFKLNASMANMVDLDRIVDFYCVAMKIFKLSQKRYGLNIYKIRYEDLIEDFEAETNGILGFLGLAWEPALVNYQTTAAARERIHTPSHSQVIKPIFKTASYRWKHYEKHLKKYKSQLTPWFEEYGY